MRPDGAGSAGLGTDVSHSRSSVVTLLCPTRTARRFNVATKLRRFVVWTLAGPRRLREKCPGVDSGAMAMVLRSRGGNHVGKNAARYRIAIPREACTAGNSYVQGRRDHRTSEVGITRNALRGAQNREENVAGTDGGGRFMNLIGMVRNARLTRACSGPASPAADA